MNPTRWTNRAGNSQLQGMTHLWMPTTTSMPPPRRRKGLRAYAESPKYRDVLVTWQRMVPLSARSAQIESSSDENGDRQGRDLWHGLDCRPQLIDQRPTVANLPPLFDTMQSIPQRQQPLAADWRRVQFLIRSDGNLTVIHCGRRFIAERDSVIADDVDAHGWVLLIDPAAAAAGDPHRRSRRRPKPVYSA